jgi:DNA-binding NtrC family response regulator
LDEIGDLTIPSQVKLLRLLQDGAYYPLRTDRPRQNRARVIVATNCDVATAASSGTFRKDLPIGLEPTICNYRRFANGERTSHC